MSNNTSLPLVSAGGSGPPRRPRRLLGIREVMHLAGIGRATIYRAMEREEFPKSVVISRGRIGWREEEIQDWIDSRPRT